MLEIKKENNMKRVNSILSNTTKTLKDLGLDEKKLNKFIDEFNKISSKTKDKFVMLNTRKKDLDYFNKIIDFFEFIKASLFSNLLM
jgi:hypothetical protein